MRHGNKKIRLINEKNKLLTDLDYNRDYYAPAQLAAIEAKIRKSRKLRSLNEIKRNLGFVK